MCVLMHMVRLSTYGGFLCCSLAWYCCLMSSVYILRALNGFTDSNMFPI